MACPGTISSALGPRSRANACSLSSMTPKSAPPTIRSVVACKAFVLDELHWFCGSDPPVSAVSSTLNKIAAKDSPGASAFPQNAGYNPTGTVAALAFWSAVIG
jgi:hypothetical protein